MTTEQTVPTTPLIVSDRVTLIALSALAYVIATAFHELLGHGGACLALGSHITELGAFYVNCAYTGMSDLGIRLVALAGPVVSVLVGMIGWWVLHQLSSTANRAKYFIWLLSSLGFMQATGYLLFSGFSRLGDFGTSRDGVLYQATPAWVWQIGLIVIGVISYVSVAFMATKAMDRMIGGSGVERIHRARLLALTSYLTGGVLAVLIGLLNPVGILIVLESAAASTLGGSSGLLWMMQLLDRNATSPAPYLEIKRSWFWIALGVIVTIIYAVVLGPTLHP